jgi:hypothetical protein
MRHRILLSPVAARTSVANWRRRAHQMRKR